MSDSDNESQLREHLADIKRAIQGLGQDLTIEIQHLDRRIGALSQRTGTEAERATDDLRRDLTKLGKTIDEGAARIPSQVSYVGQRIGTGAKRTADATAETVAKTAHRAKEGTQDLFAKAAGVKRTPMREWSAPPDDEER
jgi:hypothetical protein